MKNVMLVFDMDGTIADFYGVAGWLDKIRNFDESPYIDAQPLYPMDELCRVLNDLRAIGYKVAITSWLSMDSNEDFDIKTRIAKHAWLAKYNFPYDEIHLVKYGTNKTKCTRGKCEYQILFDDSAAVRSKWTLGEAVDATSVNILEMLNQMLKKGYENEK